MPDRHHTRIAYEILKRAELSEAESDLVDTAMEACDLAYSPYSQYHVGAAVQLSNGVVVKANNQENAAYPNGHCAESLATTYAHANYPDERIEMVAIAARKANTQAFTPVSPCGRCRQVILEFELKQKKDIRMILVNGPDRFLRIFSIQDLLPFCFNEDML
jgi:cytidine deaminase